MFVTSHFRNKAYRTPFIILIIMTISVLLAGCSNQGADPIFGEIKQKPYDKATEESAIQNYVEKINQEWNSFLIDISETEDNIDDLVERISLMSSINNLNEIDREELFVLEDELEFELINIIEIQNKFKLIAPLRSPQDYLDYMDTVTSGFIKEMKDQIYRFDQLTSQDTDVATIEEEMYTGLTNLVRRPYKYEQIILKEDVQSYMEPYVEYAEEVVVYIGLQTLLIQQEADVIASLIQLSEQVGQAENAKEEDWIIYSSEMAKLVALLDLVESEPTPVFPEGDQSNINPNRDRNTTISALPVSSSTPQTSVIIRLCGISKHNAVFTEPFRCPDITEEEKQFFDDMDEKTRDYLADWKERESQGMKAIVKEYLEKKNDGQENIFKDLYWEYKFKADDFSKKMEGEKEDHLAELKREIEDWKRDQKEEITKQLGLTLTANHQMFVISRPAYTIQVSGSNILRYDPWHGIRGIYYFPMSVNWPVGQGVQVAGGDTLPTWILGRCEEGMIYLKLGKELLGYGQGEVINPVKYAPVTIFEERGSSHYELQFNISGSGGTATIPASERNSELGGTLTWTLEVNQ